MRVDNNNNIKQYIYSNNNNNIKRVLKHISNFLLLPLSILISISILSGCSSKNIDSINNSNLVTASFTNGNGMFLKLDDSKGFAGDSIKAPDELKAPDRNPNISSENIRPILKASMLSDEFTPPLSLRSLDTGL
uniref:hypothetical protein n=1 Tax=Campylobacter vicugnae TaxID=1660076 RepID=UPI00112F97B6